MARGTAPKLLAVLMLSAAARGQLPPYYIPPDTLNIGDWSAGIWSNYHPSDIPNNAVADASNVSLDSRGVMRRRQGTLAAALPIEPTSPIVAMHRFYRTNAPPVLVYATKNDVFVSGATAAVHAFSGDAKPMFAQFGDLLLAISGLPNDKPIFSPDGVSWRQLGIESPQSMSLAAQSGGSLPVGRHEYRITYRDEYMNESGPFPGYLDQSEIASVSIDATGQKVVVSNIVPRPGFKTTVYRRGPDTGGLFFRAGITDGDVFEDRGALDDVFLERMDSSAPPQGAAAIAVHQDRAWLAVGGRVYFSAGGNPQNWSGFKWFQVDGYAGGVTALAPYGMLARSALIIFCQRAIYALIGEASDPVGDSEPWSLVQISRSRGTESPRSIAEAEGKIIYLDTAGEVHFIERTGFDKFSGSKTGDNSLSEQINDQFLGMRSARSVDRACAAYWGENYYLSIPSRGSGENDLTYVMNVRQAFSDERGILRYPWTRWSIGFTAFSVWSSGDDGYKLYGARYKTRAVLRRLETSAHGDAEEDGSINPYKLFIKTKRYDIGAAAFEAQLRRMFTRIVNNGEYNIALLMDDRTCWQRAVRAISPQNSKWNKHVWGPASPGSVLVWTKAAQAETQTFSLPVKCVGTTMQVVVESSPETSQWQVSNMALSYYIRRERAH